MRSRIKALRRINLEQAELEFLKSQLRPLSHLYVHVTPVVDVGELVFRAVPWPQKPTHTTHLSYAPASKIKTYQRANRPNQPMFYCSTGSSATIMELAPRNGERLAISKWRVEEPIIVVNCGYTEKNFVRQQSERWKKLKWAQPTDNDPPAARSRSNRLVHEFLAAEFTRQVSNGCEHEYKLSAAIAENFLSAQPVSEKD